MACVAGVLALKADGDAAACTQVLLRAMAHRAPEGSRVLASAPIALAHGALLATPEARAGLQPLQVDEWLLAVDGRIDDRADLRGRLLPTAEPTVPDEVLWAAAWRRWRHELGEHVVGDFALAAWHVPSRTLWLLRDRAGARPLYWVRNAHLFAFASEAEALLSLPGVSRERDPDRVRYYLAPALGDGDPNGSWYRDVRKLRPGRWMKVTETGEVETGRWWSPQPLTPLQLRDDGEYQEAFREVFGEAVRCRLRAPTRPALMLSGGIDSAAVLAMVRRGAPEGMAADAGVDANDGKRRGGQGGAPCQVVSVVSDDRARCDETANILRMHADEADGLRLPVPSFGGALSRGAFASLPWSPAHPVDNSLLLPMLVYRAVQDAGGRVVLDGMDGDLVMWSRNDRAARLALAGQWRAAWHEARQSSQTHTYLQGVHPARILVKGMAARLQPSSVVALRQGRLLWGWRGALGPWLATEQVQSHHLARRLWRERVQRHRATRGFTHAQGLAYAWEHAGLFRGMEGMDHLAGRFGIEPRHPWCDQRVLDFFLRLPDAQVASGGWTKRIARAACEPWLGAQVAWHSGKGHLGHQLAAAAVSHDPAHLQALLGPGGPLDGWVAPSVLAATRAALDQGVSDLAAVQLGTLAAWMATSTADARSTLVET